MKAMIIGGSTAANLLNNDRRYENQIIDASVKPTPLTTTNCVVSHVSGAVNSAGDLCPEITAWLMGGRECGWECAGYVDGSCELQHKCNAGAECDAPCCYLEHPQEESRWVVLWNKKKQCWPVAMTMDETIHLDKAEGSM